MKTRFIKSVIETAQTTKLDLPYQRGTRRMEMVAKRAAPLRRVKTA